jgi:hypothetical protein
MAEFWPGFTPSSTKRTPTIAPRRTAAAFSGIATAAGKAKGDLSGFTPVLDAAGNIIGYTGKFRAKATAAGFAEIGGPSAFSERDLALSGRAAGDRQRKRSAAGGTLITGQPEGAGINPGAVFRRRMLLGGY